MILVPLGRELRFQPRRSRALGAPPSTFHSTTLPPCLGSAAMRWIQEWGLTHSNLTTDPSSLTGWFWSNSAPNEWWAQAAPEAPVASRAPAAATPKDLMRITALLLRGCARRDDRMAGKR